MTAYLYAQNNALCESIYLQYVMKPSIVHGDNAGTIPKVNLLKILLVCFAVLAQQPVLHGQDSFVSMMNDTMHAIKYVFEARIDSVRTYPGRENGVPVPYGTADWSCGAGNFSEITYSKVWINVCRSYKGKLPQKMILLVPQPYVSTYAMAHPNGDTTLGYLHVPPSHGQYDSPLLPSRGYPIKYLYWCYDVARSKNHAGYFTLIKFMQSPMDIPGSIPRADGSSDFGRIYAMLGLNWLMDQKELSSYLKQIKTLDPDPRSKCD